MMKKRLAASCAVLFPLTLIAPVTLAQTRPLEEVLVTGSYIRSTPTDAPSPVQVIDRDVIESQGASTVWDVVKNLEVNQGSTTNENPAGENGTISGTSNVNLRNLGQNSTLTLVNGKRQVSAAALTQDGSEFVDLNAIPQVMIERLEILTDGGSALYGSDAIAGVVNLILRTDFDGMEVTGRYQQLDSGDEPSDSTFSALWGTSFNEGRTHLVIGGEYVKRDPVRVTDTPFYDARKTQFSGTLSSVTAVFGGPGPAVNPAWVNQTNTALRTERGLPGQEFTDPNCAAVGGFTGTKEEDFNNPDSSCRERTTRFQYVNVGEERKNVAVAFNHAFAEGATAYSFLQYAHNDIDRADDGNIGSLGPAFIIPSGNATYGLGSRSGGALPVINNAPNDLANGGLNRPALVDYETGIPRRGGAAVVNQSETYGAQVGLRGDFDIGTRDFNYDVSYAYSRNTILRKDRTIVRDRAELAINGLGGPNCTPNGTRNLNLNADPFYGSGAINNALFREYSPGYPQNLRETVSLALTSTNHGQGGCMFLNPFISGVTNPALANNRELLDWMTPIVPTSDRENELSVIDAVVAGQMFDLAGGPAGFAVGLQYREQQQIGKSYGLVEPGVQTIVTYGPGGVPATFRYASNDNRYGGFFTNSFEDTREIKAVFTEFSLPFIKSVETQLAVRYEDYGGSIGSELSPKIALRWQALEALAFRGSYSQSFRAPNTGIVFNGTGADGTSVRDRLSASNVRAGLAEPTENNAVDSGLFQRGLASPDVKSETADTYNFGIIFQPSWLPGLGVTLDYWRFDLQGRVVAQPLTQALQPELDMFLQARANPANYVLASSLPFTSPTRFIPCNPAALTGAARAGCVVDPRAYQITGVERNTETGQLITVDTRAVNAGRVVTDGVDLRLNYRWDTTIGDFLAGLDYTFINQYTITDLAGFESGFFGTGVNDAAGTTGDGRIVRSLPDHKGHVNLTWSRANQSVTGIVRYIGSYDDLAYQTTISNATPQRVALATRSIDAYTTFDVQYNYAKEWGTNRGTTRFTLGVIDLFQADIPFREFSSFDYDSTVFDPKGRRLYLQVNHAF